MHLITFLVSAFWIFSSPYSPKVKHLHCTLTNVNSICATKVLFELLSHSWNKRGLSHFYPECPQTVHLQPLNPNHMLLWLCLCFVFNQWFVWGRYFLSFQIACIVIFFFLKTADHYFPPKSQTDHEKLSFCSLSCSMYTVFCICLWYSAVCPRLLAAPQTNDIPVEVWM